MAKRKLTLASGVWSYIVSNDMLYVWSESGRKYQQRLSRLLNITDISRARYKCNNIHVTPSIVREFIESLYG